jgi:hypothetical protein
VLQAVTDHWPEFMALMVKVRDATDGQLVTTEVIRVEGIPEEILAAVAKQAEDVNTLATAHFMLGFVVARTLDANFAPVMAHYLNHGYASGEHWSESLQTKAH